LIRAHRALATTTAAAKQLPRSDPKFNSIFRHPKIFGIRRRSPGHHRPDYMHTEEEKLWDQVLQPHFPTTHRHPDYSLAFKSIVQSRHMERNVELGPARDATTLYGPDCVAYQRCKIDFEKALNGMLGIVMVSGEPGDTMEEYIYFDYKLKLIKSGANTFRYDDHIVYAYINNERPDLQFLKDVLDGCEEGDHNVLHFLYTESREPKVLNKVLDACKKHPYLELFGGIIEGDCFTPQQIRAWTKLKFDQEMGEVLGVLQSTPQQLVGILDKIPRETVSLLGSAQTETSLILEQYIRDSNDDS